MKKNLFLLTLMIASTTVGMSQKKNRTSAINIARGTRTTPPNYVKAKPFIDKAIKHEDTKNDAKTWMWKAQIYAGIMGSKKPAAIELRKTEDIASDVIIAMQTTKKLDKKGYYKNDLLKIARPMYINSLNGGIDAFNAKDYKKAFSLFTASQVYSDVMGRVDTVGAYNAGMAAFQLEDYESAVLNYKKCIKHGYGGSNVYLRLLDSYKKLDKNEEATALLEEAKKKFPNDQSIILNEVQQHIDSKDLESAKVTLENALKEDPDNFNLLNYSGNIYTNLEMYDQAIVVYNKALTIKPDNYDIKEDLSIAYYNKIFVMTQKLDDIDLDATEEYKNAKDERNALINKVLPLIESTYKEKESAKLKRVLNSLYGLIGQMEKKIK